MGSARWSATIRATSLMTTSMLFYKKEWYVHHDYPINRFICPTTAALTVLSTCFTLHIALSLVMSPCVSRHAHLPASLLFTAAHLLSVRCARLIGFSRITPRRTSEKRPIYRRWTERKIRLPTACISSRARTTPR